MIFLRTQMSKTDDVKEFHEAFKIPIGTTTIEELDRVDMRYRLVEEEFEELEQAMDDSDPVAILDALVDIVYVSIGFAVEMGYDFDTAWERIHASNLDKLGPDGEPIYREDGKVLKPNHWETPELDDLIPK
jgi:predicted HAD superfamily Cof-like phosphohydrolase